MHEIMVSVLNCQVYLAAEIANLGDGDLGDQTSPVKAK